MSDPKPPLRTDGGPPGVSRGQPHPDGNRCDLEFCQRCGLAFTTAIQGYIVERVDLGPDADGETARLFREDAENFGEWQGFGEEDLGAWCDSCSWVVQRRRTENRRAVA